MNNYVDYYNYMNNINQNRNSNQSKLGYDTEAYLGFIRGNMFSNLYDPYQNYQIQELNPNKKEASRSMITFLVLNTSGLTLIPTTIISMRLLYGSTNPTEIILPCILATLISTITGLTLDRILYYRSKHG